MAPIIKEFTHTVWHWRGSILGSDDSHRDTHPADVTVSLSRITMMLKEDRPRLHSETEGLTEN